MFMYTRWLALVSFPLLFALRAAALPIGGDFTYLRSGDSWVLVVVGAVLLVRLRLFVHGRDLLQCLKAHFGSFALNRLGGGQGKSPVGSDTLTGWKEDGGRDGEGGERKGSRGGSEGCGRFEHSNYWSHPESHTMCISLRYSGSVISCKSSSRAAARSCA